MTTTISIPAADYQRAKTLADERHITVDELFVLLIHNLTDSDKQDDDISLDMPEGALFNPYQCSPEELDQRFDKIEEELEEEEGIPYEQMMAELKQEFSWLK